MRYSHRFRNLHRITTSNAMSQHHVSLAQYFTLSYIACRTQCRNDIKRFNKFIEKAYSIPAHRIEFRYKFCRNMQSDTQISIYLI